MHRKVVVLPQPEGTEQRGELAIATSNDIEWITVKAP